MSINSSYDVALAFTQHDLELFELHTTSQSDMSIVSCKSAFSLLELLVILIIDLLILDWIETHANISYFSTLLC